jgi:hypothetical protein
MENLKLTLQSTNQIIEYRNHNHLVKYEYEILNELLDAIKVSDETLLNWFNTFGKSLRAITMNVHAYRMGLEFGFTEIAYDKYDWFKRPEFLDKEDLVFGDTSRYGNHSIIHLGRGANQIWTYALNYSFGCAGGSYALSVYGKQFKCREDALDFALNELKNMMTAKVGSTDTTNDKQPIIIATLRDIEKYKVSMVQLTLF